MFPLLFTSACSSCGKDPPASATPDASASADAGARPRTTSPELAIGNLNADIEQQLASKSAHDKVQAVGLLLDRAHYLGKVADLELAENVVTELAEDSGEVHHARATVHAALHRFDEAVKELDLARKQGAPTLRVGASLASIHLARGQYDLALALQPPFVTQQDSITIASAAVLANKMQKPEWEGLFRIARNRFRDVSPFGLAWMDFQQGSLHELSGEDAKARAWFTEAAEVLPRYAHAVVHLAPMLPAEEAVTRLEKLRETSDDPEVLAAIATAQKRAGRESDALVELAKKRYDEVVAKYPEAFADHAARFWLGAGNDPKRALELARSNARNRVTEESLDLWMAAAAGAKSDEDVCSAVRAMAGFAYLSPRGKTLVNASRTKCGL